jgi:predicted amidophosphoribosyltransferase
VSRTIFTATQTNKSLGSRWENVENAFEIIDDALLKNKHICLVDDVITTGASLEACGRQLLKIEGLQLSILSVGFTV